ncbi:hypothetical protein EVAR_89981_1 [Eumeta japonica]|uniref:Uncharacterized protein n=1 Tax=Eumeta variegata TaxID=151549 RepID=A0A4C2ACN6_EUMVA|nr:hypothetical protein EVAR_89981_1 [Eumeta japonica]
MIKFGQLPSDADRLTACRSEDPPNHSIGSSDGRVYKGRDGFRGLPASGQENMLIPSVARVRPRTSKGITDLLLLNLAAEAAGPSKKILITPPVRAARRERTGMTTPI